ncbi:regulator of chromosome condensation 1/beta-lactamase-inhibitor protein II [Aspergillus coremiiformis]|uniref:Regulator of chromosome condensation 1/beta-lactamase-inhibitor protein II n=1 Tax=Aspergillus coremiiformis TaxID=138285 RepID=A0A5N6YZU6_9EURO|nr:regulator of chromosome condensation 1/beta-lactamase-inhibitor protein II [Aspergillus coremiiformis]
MPPKPGPSTRKRNAPDSAQQRSNASARNKREVGKTSTDAATQKPPREPAPTLNTAPTQRLDVYVFGTNCYGELGLGDATKKTEIPRPVLNPKLAADTVGVVDLAVGGVHSAALTYDNRILTWGVNDEGALGRDTTQDAEEIKMRSQSDSGSDSEDDEGNLNLKEATPLPVDPSHFPDRTIFTQLAATGSATFALTAEGLVYGWGTFRGNSGEMGFSPGSKQQQRIPTLISGLDHVVKLAAGSQHVLALTSKGTVFGWGCDDQHQLGRRRTHHQTSHCLVPAECALPSGIINIGVGSYHSFAIHKSGTVYAWGSNNYGQTAILTGAGQSEAVVAYPTKVPSLKRTAKIVSIEGGKDHSLAVTHEGECLSWGRIDNKALGLDVKDMPSSHIVYDAYERPRILKAPTVVRNIDQAIVSVGIGTDHSFAITEDGRAYSWGFNVQNQAGQPGDVDEIVHPTLLSNKHVDGKKLVLAAAGGQFSLVAGEHTTK